MMMMMMDHRLQVTDLDDRLAEYQHQPTTDEITTTTINQPWQWPLLARKRNFLLASVHVAAVVLLLVAMTIAIAGNRGNPYQQQCPDDVNRWVYYNGFYFHYYLFLQEWPNPDPKILILEGNGWSEEKGNGNEYSSGEGCGGGGWTMTPYQYVVPDDTTNGGAFYINGVEYDLKNDGSVFLIESLQDNKLTQVNGLDLASLVIDSETMSIASVTAFCMANQQILEFYDSRINAEDN